MTKIIFATGNKDKLREIKEILSDCDVEIQSMKEAGINVDIVEDGKTFEDNALIKARAIAAHTDAIVLHHHACCLACLYRTDCFLDTEI